MTCWCGATSFDATPHEAYLECGACGTLVLRALIEEGPEALRRTLAGYYGEAYWREHQRELSYPTIEERARLDLAERCNHWVRDLLRYRRPPARVLEIGCAHGGFLKLLELAGFEVCGVELDPAVVDLAKATFGITVRLGPEERAGLPVCAYDVAALYDVFEHLVDPVNELLAMRKHLVPQGIVIIQTPDRGRMQDSSWPYFQSPEHVWLFTRRGLSELLSSQGLQHQRFEASIFDNLTVVASETELREASQAELAESLLASPGGRVVLALQDLYWSLRAARAEVQQGTENQRQGRVNQETLIAQLTQTTHAMETLRGAHWTKLGEALGLIGRSGE